MIIKTLYIPELEKQILSDQINIDEYLEGDIVCYLEDVLISGEVLARLKELPDFQINIYGFEKIGNKVKLMEEKEVLTDCKVFKIEKQYRTEHNYVNIDFKVGGVIESTSVSEWECDLENILKI